MKIKGMINSCLKSYIIENENVSYEITANLIDKDVIRVKDVAG